MYRPFLLFNAVVLLGGGCDTPADSSFDISVPSDEPQAALYADPLPAIAPLLDTPVFVGPSQPRVADFAPVFITMTSGNFFFDPSAIVVHAGQTVSISFSGNEGVHTFVMDELGIKKSITIGTVVTFSAPLVPGKYAYYCDVGAHRKLGMEGVLIVE